MKRTIWSIVAAGLMLVGWIAILSSPHAVRQRKEMEPLIGQREAFAREQKLQRQKSHDELTYDWLMQGYIRLCAGKDREDPNNALCRRVDEIYSQFTPGEHRQMRESKEKGE